MYGIAGTCWLHIWMSCFHFLINRQPQKVVRMFLLGADLPVNPEGGGRERTESAIMLLAMEQTHSLGTTAAAGNVCPIPLQDVISMLIKQWKLEWIELMSSWTVAESVSRSSYRQKLHFSTLPALEGHTICERKDNHSWILHFFHPFPTSKAHEQMRN